MTVKRVLGILPKNQMICVITERYAKRLYKGNAWALDSKYILSLLVTDLWCDPYQIYVFIQVVEI